MKSNKTEIEVEYEKLEKLEDILKTLEEIRDELKLTNSNKHQTRIKE